MSIPSFEIAYQAGPPSPPALHVDSIAQMLRGHAWIFDAHSHPSHHQIFWINRGTGRVEIDGYTRGFGPNTVVFIPAGIVHGFEFSPSSSGWVATMSQTSPIPVALPETAMQFALNAREDQTALTAICDDINKEQSGDAPQKEVALACQAGLLSIWLVRHLAQNEQKEQATTSARRLMCRFRRTLEQEFSKQHGVSFFAESLGVTTTHLTRVCRQTAGNAATSLIQNRTILDARLKLAATDMKVSAIGNELGFASAAYFTRLFAQKTGQSPSAFRKTHRQLTVK